MAGLGTVVYVLGMPATHFLSELAAAILRVPAPGACCLQFVRHDIDVF